MEDKCQSYLLIEVDDPYQAATLIEEKLQTTDYDVLPDGKIKLYRYIRDVSTVSHLLVENQLEIH